VSLSEPPEDPRTRANLNPALAVRVGIVGSVVLALFAIVFFRLWFLQVLTGTHYVEAAARNTTERVAIAPARGEILSRSGKSVLVSSTTALAAVIVPDELPVKVNQTNILQSFSKDDAVYTRLAHLLHMKTHRRPCKVATPPPSCNTATGHCPTSTTRDLSPIACTVAQQIALNFYADVTVRQPVSRDLEYYVAERAGEFRGIQVQQVSVSGYPDQELAAQTLGTVGRISQTETTQSNFKGANPNAIVGQSGLEYEYDKYLRGTYGRQNVKVNADGIAVGQGKKTQPTPGDDLKTTLDLRLEKVGDQALARSVSQNGAGIGGAFVAMDPENGSIYGMGSLPSFNPQVFTGQGGSKTIARLEHETVAAPLVNRATQSEVGDGSTFKVITSVAALESGVWSPDKTFDDTGRICFGAYCPRNAEGAANGVINMVQALKLSDDVFYYNLGALMNSTKPQGGALQTWARRFGVGRNPHIDLPAAKDGLLPTPAWYDRTSRLEDECDAAIGPFKYTDGKGDYAAKPRRGYHRTPKSPSGSCPYGTPDSVWTIGQNVETAVGQGEDEISPLQLAMVYAAIENGGTIVRPHLGQDIQSPGGTILQRLSFPAQRHLHIDPEYLNTVRTGLNEAAQSPGGTSAAVMENFGMPVYGKTGTDQTFEQGVETDSAWYATYVPASATHKPIVVVVWVQGGGFGAIGAAPVARQILSQWYYGKPGPWVEGNSQDQ
jgi:penicillin-binding protein 2